MESLSNKERSQTSAKNDKTRVIAKNTIPVGR
jgi:hypothetical protein